MIHAKFRHCFLLLLSTFLLNGCTSYMAATNSGPITEDYGKRTMGTVIEDRNIQSKAQININRSSEALNNANISITSYNQVILITGQVPDQQSKNQVTAIAEKIRHVRRVHNELEILPTSTMMARTSDTFLSTKIKSNLLSTKGVDSSRINIIVKNGKVYLMGLVTQDEAKRCVNSVKEVSGIKAIIKVFEYISNEAGSA